VLQHKDFTQRREDAKQTPSQRLFFSSFKFQSRSAYRVIDIGGMASRLPMV
jgi:hypothetical protein